MAAAEAFRDFELELLRKGVSALVAGRARCASCHRTPLVGERVHRYQRDALLCDLCRRMRAETPDATEIVRGSERGHAVRACGRARRAA